MSICPQVFVLGLKKLSNNAPFGNKIAKKFNIGDLVSWVDWNDYKDGRLTRTIRQGILTNIICKYLGEREVTFACILPMKSDQIIELNITQIRKM